MNDFLFLVPIALILGFIGLLAFVWSLKTSQYDDMDGAAERILFEEEDKPAQACSTQRGMSAGKRLRSIFVSCREMTD